MGSLATASTPVRACRSTLTTTLLRIGWGSNRPPNRTDGSPAQPARPGLRRGAGHPGAPSGGWLPGLQPVLDGQHVVDVGAGLVVEAVPTYGAEALVVGADLAGAGDRLRGQHVEQGHPGRHVVAQPSRLAGRGRRRAPSTATVDGSTCMAPIAPALETWCICQPASCHDTASESWGSTPWRRETRTMAWRTRWREGSDSFALRAGLAYDGGQRAFSVGGGAGLVDGSGDDRDLDPLPDRQRGPAAEVVVGDQLSGPGVEPDGQLGGGVAGPHRVVLDVASVGQAFVLGGCGCREGPADDDGSDD